MLCGGGGGLAEKTFDRYLFLRAMKVTTNCLSLEKIEKLLFKYHLSLNRFRELCFEKCMTKMFSYKLVQLSLALSS